MANIVKITASIAFAEPVDEEEATQTLVEALADDFADVSFTRVGD